jgi:hypothetical protein
MRLSLHDDGLVDDLHVDAQTVALRRTGVARYELHAGKGSEVIVLEIWTTQRLTLEIDGHEPPGWVRVTSDDVGIVTVDAGQCRLHFEHLERRAYILILCRGPADEWRAVVRAPGYVKTRVLHRETPPS